VTDAVVVTGIGIISPLGLYAEPHFDRLLTGDSVIERVNDLEYGNYPAMLQARIQNFDPRVFVPDRMLRKLLASPSTYALEAGTEAINDSGIGQSELVDCGLYVGSPGLQANPEIFIPALRHSVDENDILSLSRFATHGMKLLDPLFIVKSLPNSGLCAIAIQHQVLGPNASITNGHVSGLQAVIAATESIRRGQTQMALAGGYDSLLRMDAVIEHLLAGRLATPFEQPKQACRPFDRRRSGYALGEGAVFLMLETADHAYRRSARVYGEILSFAQSTLPSSLIHPSSDSTSLTSAVKLALEQGDTHPDKVDAVFADALAIADDDDREAKTYTNVFCESRPPITGFSATLGYPGAATGLLSLAHALLAMKRGVVPPLINCEQPMSEYCMNIVRQPCTVKVRHALAWTSDRGIKNAVALVRSH
jgi:3-oxoacyl-(acyl-carrier-protein) synthase